MPGAASSRFRRLLAAGIVALFLALQAALAFRLNINWDEYWFLSRIHLANAGTLHEPFQTFHVRLLFWLAELPLSDPDRIVAGRLAMLACEAAALACLYAIARRCAGGAAALIVVALWCGGGYALAHGASFRTDPLAAALLMGALALLTARRGAWWSDAVAGLLAALALLVTVKSVFYLPAFAAAALVVSSHQGGVGAALRRFAVAGASLALFGGGLWLWHSGALGDAGGSLGGALDGAVRSGGGAANKVAATPGWFPRADYIAAWALSGAIALGAILAGSVLALRQAVRGPGKRAGAALLLCLAPLAALAFYRNAFPYFFPFLLFPVALAALPTARRLAREPRPLAELLLAALGLLAAWQAVRLWPHGQEAQRAYAAAAESMFARAVPYIDRNAMLPSWPQTGMFMTSWGVEEAAARGRPALAEAIARDAPPLLIVNSPVIEAALDPAMEWPGPRLVPADARALRETYIPHWGALWVAGKRLAGPEGRFVLRLGGRYTLECSGRRTLDGSERACGSVVSLEAGPHDWSGGAARLRWGDHLPRPAAAPPQEPIYHGF